MTAPEDGPRLDQAGTQESAWSGAPWGQLSGLHLARYPRAVIVAPHPDDEVLGCAGLMQRLAAQETALTVVGVTAGEASHPRSTTTTREALAGRRARERQRALDLLALRDVTVVPVALPDGAVAGSADDLVAQLCRLLGPDVLCVSPWEHDGHPDHDATGRAAAVACAATGAPFLNCLVWTWHWAVPGDPRVPWSGARRLVLTRIERTRKHWAAQSFRSQVAPLSPLPGDEAILPAETMAYFERPFEVFLA